MMNERPIVVENVVSLPKTAVRLAAGLLVLGLGPTYFPAKDITRPTQAKVFSEPESFPQAQHGSTLVVLTNYYNAAADVTRLKPQAKVFSEPETFVKEQRSTAPALNVPPYFFSQDVQRALQAKVFSEPESFLQPQRGFLLVDFLPYVPGNDVTRLRAQTKWFGEPESFVWAQRASVITNAAVTDVTRFKPQAKLFSEPESFASAAPHSLATITILYNPAKDVQRARMAYTWSEAESFQRAAPYNAVILNGAAGATSFRVQAVSAGISRGVYYNIGDVFDVAAADFSDSTVNYAPNSTDSPLYGWMKVVPATYPLFQFSLGAGQGFSSDRLTPRRTVL